MPLQNYQSQQLAGFLEDTAALSGMELHLGEIRSCSHKELWQVLSPYTFHGNPFCMMVKENLALHDRCVRNQTRIYKRLLQERAPFMGVCHCGVKEYIVPIFHKDEPIGFISLSGFQPEPQVLLRRLRGVSARYNFPIDTLTATYEQTFQQVTVPNKETENKVGALALLLSSLSLQVDFNVVRPKGSTTQQLFIMERAKEYLHAFYQRPIHISDIAEYCGCSKSSVQHLFRSYFDEPISTYLRTIRLERACFLLRTTLLSVFNVAAQVGFQDANYFSLTFSRTYNLSPTGYRKQSKEA